jgi:hypothetical protein
MCSGLRWMGGVSLALHLGMVYHTTRQAYGSCYLALIWRFRAGWEWKNEYFKETPGLKDILCEIQSPTEYHGQ